MLDIKIDALQINMEGAAGHEHRIRPIAARAAAIFAERLDDYCAEASGLSGTRRLDSVNAAQVDANLNTMTDEQAANSIARSWLDAIALKLR
jgi:hypothetical protein